MEPSASPEPDSAILVLQNFNCELYAQKHVNTVEKVIAYFALYKQTFLDRNRLRLQQFSKGAEQAKLLKTITFSPECRQKAAQTLEMNIFCTDLNSVELAGALRSFTPSTILEVNEDTT